MPKPLAAEKQLALARCLVEGVPSKTITKDVGVSMTTVKGYRGAVFNGLEERGIQLHCGCGKPVGHRGYCKAGRKLAPGNPEISDEVLCEILEEQLAEPNSTSRKRRKPTSDEKFAQELGRAHGMGESLGSIQRRLKVDQIRFERLRRDCPRAWQLGIKQGEEYLAAAKRRREAAAEADVAPPPSGARAGGAPKPGPAPTGAHPAALTPAERRVLKLLADAWNSFCGLPGKTEDDIDEFKRAIHRAQAGVAARVARRVDPTVWRQP